MTLKQLVHGSLLGVKTKFPRASFSEKSQTVLADALQKLMRLYPKEEYLDLEVVRAAEIKAKNIDQDDPVAWNIFGAQLAADLFSTVITNRHADAKAEARTKKENAAKKVAEDALRVKQPVAAPAVKPQAATDSAESRAERELMRYLVTHKRGIAQVIPKGETLQDSDLMRCSECGKRVKQFVGYGKPPVRVERCIQCALEFEIEHEKKSSLVGATKEQQN